MHGLNPLHARDSRFPELDAIRLGFLSPHTSLHIYFRQIRPSTEHAIPRPIPRSQAIQIPSSFAVLQAAFRCELDVAHTPRRPGRSTPKANRCQCENMKMITDNLLKRSAIHTDGQGLPATRSLKSGQNEVPEIGKDTSKQMRMPTIIMICRFPATASCSALIFLRYINASLFIYYISHALSEKACKMLHWKFSNSLNLKWKRVCCSDPFRSSSHFEEIRYF